MCELNKITVTKIKQMFTVASPRGRNEIITDRSCYGLSFCVDGQITYTSSGKQIVSDRDHAIFLPKGKSYSLHGDKDGRFPVINFECNNFLCEEVLSFSIQNMESYIRDYKKMKALSLFEGNMTILMSIFYGMLYRISRDSTVPDRLTPAIRLIERNFQCPELSNIELAKECNISEVYFRKLFLETFNTTPKQYLIEIRINKAKQLLEEGILKVGAVAEQCGFTNPYYFCRLFKKKTGFSPTEFIKNNRIYKI